MVTLGPFNPSSTQAASGVPSPRLVRAAHEFEGQLLQELLKPMTDSDGLTGDSETGSAGALGSFAAEALGEALSRQGGLGIATQIVHSLSRSGKASDVPSVTGNLHKNTEISGRE